MNVDTVPRTLAVAAVIALVCSALVSTAVTYLRPQQVGFETLERYRAILLAAGELTEDATDREVASALQAMDVRVVDLETGWYASGQDAQSLVHWASSGNLAGGATENERSRYVPVYHSGDDTNGIVVLPVDGSGMWSTIYAFVALEPDYNTIRNVVIYKHGETPGIGDRIEEQDWVDSWRGKKLRDNDSVVRFRVTKNASGPFEVDALTGATVTSVATGTLVRQWIDDDAFGPFLARLADRKP